MNTFQNGRRSFLLARLLSQSFDCLSRSSPAPHLKQEINLQVIYFKFLKIHQSYQSQMQRDFFE